MNRTLERECQDYGHSEADNRNDNQIGKTPLWIQMRIIANIGDDVPQSELNGDPVVPQKQIIGNYGKKAQDLIADNFPPEIKREQRRKHKKK